MSCIQCGGSGVLRLSYEIMEHGVCNAYVCTYVCPVMCTINAKRNEEIFQRIVQYFHQT